MKNECDCMKMVNSENVIKLIDVNNTTKNYYLLLELCNGCDLNVLREKRGKFLPEIEARVIIQ